MDSFLRGLSGYALKCRKENMELKNGSIANENKYKQLQNGVKLALSEPKKLQKTKYLPPCRRKAKTSLETFQEAPSAPVLSHNSSFIADERIVTTPMKDCLPAPFPTYNYALPVQPIVGAKRFYRSKAHQRREIEKLRDLENEEDEVFPDLPYPGFPSPNQQSFRFGIFGQAQLTNHF